ncbi:MAG: dihydropteroate synthase [Deltaproteobacteria bacterium]|nr:dihydropteroate synthase [Deltaproteobacteria bacterium]
MSRPPLVMGVLNVTPDSFYDGGRYESFDAAIVHGMKMADQGADIIDIGGESTRPGASLLEAQDEIERVVQVVKALSEETESAISIDTRRTVVAGAALEAGAIMVNDVSAFTFDPDMPALLGRLKPLAVAMHMRGGPEDMQSHTRYASLLDDVADELWNHASRALAAGLPEDHLILDPGIGFAKTWRQNLVLINRLDVFGRFGRPLLVGTSRKSFIGRILGSLDPKDRLFGTAGAVAMAVARGARVLRVHDVAEMTDVVQVAHAISASEIEDEAA